ELADRGRAKSLTASRKQDGFLIDEISGKMRINIAEDRIVFDERRYAVACGWDGVGGIDRIAEGPRVAKEMSGRHPGGVSHGEGGKQCMWVREIDTCVAHSGQRGRGLRCYRIRAQAIGHEQNQIAKILRARRRDLQENGARD